MKDQPRRRYLTLKRAEDLPKFSHFFLWQEYRKKTERERNLLKQSNSRRIQSPIPQLIPWITFAIDFVPIIKKCHFFEAKSFGPLDFPFDLYKAAVFSFVKVTEVPDLDGFTVYFFQQFRNIIYGDLLLSLFQQFWDNITIILIFPASFMLVPARQTSLGVITWLALILSCIKFITKILAN